MKYKSIVRLKSEFHLLGLYVVTTVQILTQGLLQSEATHGYEPGRNCIQILFLNEGITADDF